MGTAGSGDEDLRTRDERGALIREASIMGLYISIVLLAAITSLPATFGEDAEGGLAQLVLTIWGTTIGLALAHWFAFNVVSIGYHGGTITKHDVKSGGIQVGAAAAVALLTTIPVVIFSAVDSALDAAAIGPCLVLAASGYLIARSARRSHSVALFSAFAVVVIGLAVAVVKSVISGGH